MNILYVAFKDFAKLHLGGNKKVINGCKAFEQMGHTDISTTENVYIKNRNRMEEKSCKLGKIDELRLDPVKEDASDLNSNCKVISFPGKSHPDANSSHPEVFTKI